MKLWIKLIIAKISIILFNMYSSLQPATTKVRKEVPEMMIDMSQYTSNVMIMDLTRIVENDEYGCRLRLAEQLKSATVKAAEAFFTPQKVKDLRSVSDIEAARDKIHRIEATICTDEDSEVSYKITAKHDNVLSYFVRRETTKAIFINAIQQFLKEEDIVAGQAYEIRTSFGRSWYLDKDYTCRASIEPSNEEWGNSLLAVRSCNTTYILGILTIERLHHKETSWSGSGCDYGRYTHDVSDNYIVRLRSNGFEPDDHCIVANFAL